MTPPDGLRRRAFAFLSGDSMVNNNVNTFSLEMLAKRIRPKVKEFERLQEAEVSDVKPKSPNVQKTELEGWRPETVEYGGWAAFCGRDGTALKRRVSLPPFNSDKLNFGKKTKRASERAARMCLALLDLQKYDRSNHCGKATIVPIPTTYERFTNVLGNAENVSLAVSNLISIGVLEEFRESYRFVSEGTKFPGLVEARSKSYLLHHANEMKFKEWCDRRGLRPWTMAENKRKNFLNMASSAPERTDGLDDYRINQRTDIKRRNGESAAKCEERIRRNLYAVYPMMRELSENIRKFNALQKDDCRKLRANPRINWNKAKTKVTSVGFRATCELCSLPKVESRNRPHLLPWRNRREALEAMNLTSAERDVKSSVPRLGNFLHTGKYLPQGEDCYEMIFREAKASDAPDNPFKNESWNERTRAAMKPLFMLANFSPSWRKASASLEWNERRDGGLSLAERDSQRNYIKHCKAAIDKFTGGRSESSEIFLYESCVCVSAALELAERGMQVFLCYDGFYLDSPLSQEEFERLVEGKAMEFKRKYPYLFDNYKYVSTCRIPLNSKASSRNISFKFSKFTKLLKSKRKNHSKLITVVKSYGRMNDPPGFGRVLETDKPPSGGDFDRIDSEDSTALMAV